MFFQDRIKTVLKWKWDFPYHFILMEDLRQAATFSGGFLNLRDITALSESMVIFQLLILFWWTLESFHLKEKLIQSPLPF